MKTLGKVVDATVLVGSGFLAVGSLNMITNGINTKNNSVIALGTLALLISVYALKEAAQKINE